MSAFEKLDKLVELNNGYLCTSQVIDINVSKTYLAEYVQKRNMQRVAHGIYMSDNAWYDEMYIIHLKNEKVIFSHESALYMHTLIDSEPYTIMLSVPLGYNATHLRKKNYKVFSVNPKIFTLGLIEKETVYGNKVLLYDMNRTICDTIKNKNSLEIQTFQTALKEYIRCKDKNINNLLAYAQELNITTKVRTYMEILM